MENDRLKAVAAALVFLVSGGAGAAFRFTHPSGGVFGGANLIIRSAFLLFVCVLLVVIVLNDPYSVAPGAQGTLRRALGASCPRGTTGDTYRVKCSTDSSGNAAGFTYDAAGNLTKKADTTTTGGTGAAVQQYTYENSVRTVCGGSAGQVCSSEDGNNNVTTHQYTGAGNLLFVTPSAPMGATTYTYDGPGYIYDLRDRLVQTTFDGGTTLSVTYYPNGSPQYQADSFTGTKQFEYDMLGHTARQIGALAGVIQKYITTPPGTSLSSKTPPRSLPSSRTPLTSSRSRRSRVEHARSQGIRPRTPATVNLAL